MMKKILLVEDNETDEKLMVRAFKKCAIMNEVVVVRDGAEALDYLFRTGKYAGNETLTAPAVTLLDLQLPKIAGLDVLKQIRRHELTRMLPVIILTSSKEDEDILKSYSLGANAYVRKPIDFGQFAEAVRTVGLFWLLLNEPPPFVRPSAT